MDQAAPPPFGWSVNGEPVRDRDGKQIMGQRRQRVMLGICGPCNAAMERAIEAPAQPAVTALALNGWKGEYAREEWRAVGLWLAKVLLLVAHEDSRLENPRLQKAIRYAFDPPMPDLRWLTDGSGVPGHVSLFVHNADMDDDKTEFQLSIPAQVHSDEGNTSHCHVLSMATPGLCATVVSHPGITLDHPMVRQGQAWELLHSPPRRGDLSTLPPLSRMHVRYVRGGGVPDGHVADESEFKFLSALFGYESEGAARPGFVGCARGWLGRLLRASRAD